MAIYNTPDGRQVVGSTVAGNDYHGFNGKRDIIIQLTADGATTDGLNALEYLKAYAVEQNKQNKPIFPNGTRVFISANGYTKAVEADDVVIDGDNITIGGIKWDGSAWDYTNAGQSGGGGLPEVTPADAGKVLTVNNSGVWGAEFLDRNVLIIEPVGGKSPYSASEIDEIAKAGVFVVLISVYNNISKVYVYTGLANGNAYFSRIYNRENTETISIAENKTVGNAGIIRIYQKPSTGIPETDLAQAVKDKLNKFVVTLTPTSADYSGTMDKTVAEINAAYEAGQEIWFNVRVAGNVTLMSHVNEIYFNTDFLFPSFQANVMVDSSTFLKAYTGPTDTGTGNSYDTMVYTPTPAT